MRIAPFGERAILVTFADAIEPRANALAHALADAWEARGIGPAVPAYASTLLHYDPLAHPRREVLRLASTLALAPASRAPAGRRVEIPVRYDGLDLEEVANLSRLSVADIVALHSGREYLAYFVGFMPGFAYLGELDARIVAPRLAEPRPRVPAGSVGVAGRQTGVYPFASPGGWRLLGTTHAVLFDARRDPPSFVLPGDRVRFVTR